jgi:hypothetical protein
MRSLLLNPSMPIQDEDTVGVPDVWTVGTTHEALTPV